MQTMLRIMRPSLSTPPLLLFFFFILGCSLCTSIAATSMPPSTAPAPSPSGFHPADTVEEACHLMVYDDNQIWLEWYPLCVAALRSNPESRNATIHKLAVLAAEIVLQDVVVELRRMREMQSRGVGGNPQELYECLSGFDFFIPRLQSGIEDLQGDGRVGFQFFFIDTRDFVDCRWMEPSPVKKQSEILALLQALRGICNKYCTYPAPKPCRGW